MKIKTILKYHANELSALLLFFVGGSLSMLGLIQRVPLVAGIAGVVILSTGLFYFCLNLSSEKVRREYFEESFSIEHDSIEQELRRSGTYAKYQKAVIDRYESACRDLGISDEQRDWLLKLLTEAKELVDKELEDQGGGHI